MTILSVQNIAKAFGGVRAVNGVSFVLQRGEVLALIGPNGAGKSTCFNLLNGQLKPDAGRIVFDGVDITGMRPRDIWHLGVGRTFQIPATYASMTVRENVQMVLLSKQAKLLNIFQRAGTSGRAAAMELLGRVGIADMAERPCSVLAYGDIKRVELAMAIAHEPKLLLMDEPTAGMAAQERYELMTLIAELVRERGMAVLFTEHSMDVVFSYAHRVLVMSRGELIASGDPASVRNDPLVQEVYLGSGILSSTLASLV